MATLTAAELQAGRRSAARAATVPWTKAQYNAALQAVEDRMVSLSNVGGNSIRQAISTAIENAAPGVFNAAQKDDLFIVWSLLNARRGGIV
jgi:hypothetical protein